MAFDPPWSPAPRAERSPNEAALWGGGTQRPNTSTYYQEDTDIRFGPHWDPVTSFRLLWTLTGPQLDLKNAEHGLMPFTGVESGGRTRG